MKKIIGLFFLCSIFSSVLFASTISKENKNTQALFVMLAKEASIQPTQAAGIYNLKLKGVNPQVIYFSNRPLRMSGHLPTNKFLNQWEGKGVFNKIAPNAVMELVKLDDNSDKLQNALSSYAIVLNHPSYSGKDMNEITFKAKTLPGSKTVLASLRKSDYVAIFIDDVCISCIG